MSQKKILIIKLSSLGDVVHTLPVSRTLRKEYPKAYIAWIIEERYQDLLRKNSDIDEVIPLMVEKLSKLSSKIIVFKLPNSGKICIIHH